MERLTTSFHMKPLRWTLIKRVRIFCYAGRGLTARELERKLPYAEYCKEMERANYRDDNPDWSWTMKCGLCGGTEKYCSSDPASHRQDLTSLYCSTCGDQQDKKTRKPTEAEIDMMIEDARVVDADWFAITRFNEEDSDHSDSD